MKQEIGLVIDQGADFPKKIIEKYKIEVVPIKLDWPEIQELPGENIYQKMREAERQKIKSFGKTSQASPKDFLVAYKKQLENFENIICITLSSKLSETHNSAVQAKNFLPSGEQKRIFIVDSLNVTGGEALLIIKAIELIEGKKIKTKEIADRLTVLSEKIHIRIIFKDPKWIEASGRMSTTMANWIRRMGKIGVRPLLGIKDGVIKSMGIKSGVKIISNALFKEIEDKTKDLRKKDKKISIIINHGDDKESAEKLKKRIEQELVGANVLFINLVNDIVGIVGGPDSLAVSWTES